MRIDIRIDVSIVIGIDHVMRCLTLVAALNSNVKVNRGGYI